MKSHPTAGFSLVEIVLALGVISFAVVGLLGLMAATQQTVRESADRTDNSLLFEKVVNQLKIKPFKSAQTSSPSEATVLPLPALNVISTPETEGLFLVDEKYDYAGLVENDQARANASKVVRVIVLDSPILHLLSLDDPTPASAEQLAFVRIEISGPAVAYRPAERSAPDKQVFVTEISRVEQ